MLPSRKMTPTMIRMNGPVIERRRRGGATTGLDMVHLTGWRHRNIWIGRRWHGRLNRWRRKDRWPSNVSCLRRITLQELYGSDDQQDQRPGPFERRPMEVVHQEQDPDRDHDGR